MEVLVISSLEPSLPKIQRRMGSKFNQPLYTMTVEEFIELLDERIKAAISNETAATPATRPTGRLVYGLRGIRELFGVSHLTAQRYKDGIIKEAVRQNGRKIVVDADYALELFSQRTAK